jgi:hypothetical protein
MNSSMRQFPVLLGLILAPMVINIPKAVADQSIVADIQYAETYIETLTIPADADLVKPRHHSARSTAATSRGRNCQAPIAQADNPACPTPESPEALQAASTDRLDQLANLPTQQFPTPGGRTAGLSPGTTISNPSGFGADGNRVFLITDYQGRTRYTNTNDGEVGIGVALGNAKTIGAELSYTQASFGRSGKAGGGFSTKIHHRFSDTASIALGWNYFAKVGAAGYLDYPNNSYYTAYSQIFKTREFIDQPFSRVAVVMGVGSGQFLSESQSNRRNPQGLNVFSSVALRVAQPVSLITEWTGQDLAMGLSIVPFKHIPFVITPAFRDITGAGDGARFVVGTGFSFKL